MQALWKAVLVVVVAVTALATTFVGLLALGVVVGITAGGIPRWATPVFLAAVFGVPMGVAFLVARGLSRRLFRPSLSLRLPRPVGRALIVGYLVTAIFGVPACQTFRAQWAVAEYKRIHASGDRRVWEAHPYVATYASIPLLPGVVLEYHEYQLSGLYGFGGLELFVWYGAGVKSLGQLPLWLS